MEKAATIEELIAKGVLTPATLPPHNEYPQGIERLTMPLIAEDYPAKTAAMWNAAYREIGLPDRNCMMLAYPKQVELIIEVLRSDPRYVGGGAGVGFKEVVIPYLDDLLPLAKAMGSVNIIKKKDGRLIGGNTDGEGYAVSLAQVLIEKGKALEGAQVMILGAGGTARAIAFALAHKGAVLSILNRTENKAHELAQSLNKYFGHEVAIGGGRDLVAEFIRSADAVVSTIDDAHSPLDAYSTLGDMELPITDESRAKNMESAQRLLKTAKPSLIVSDIRIRKEPTAMLAQAKSNNFRVLNGIPMVINQGVAAFCWVYQDTLKKVKFGPGDIAHIMSEAAQ